MITGFVSINLIIESIIDISIILIREIQQKMNDFQHQLDKAIKSFIKLSETHRNLFQMSDLKIINRQQMYRNPFINDQLFQWKSELEGQRKNIEDNSQNVRQVIEALVNFPKASLINSQVTLLARVIMRSIQIVENTNLQFQNDYYEGSNKKFKLKCSTILAEIALKQPFQIIKMLYKHFRHLALVQLERYQEILDCISQTDFQSISRFKKDFYAILQKTQSKKKVINHQNYSASTPNIQSKQQHRQQQIHLPAIQTHSAEPHQHHQALLQHQKITNKHQENSVKDQNKKSIQNIEKRQNAHIKTKLKASDSAKKIAQLLNPVMQTKKDQINSGQKDEKQIYSSLITRNKVNQIQINNYEAYSQHMKQRRFKTDQFYYYHQADLSNQIQQIHQTEQNKPIFQTNLQKQSMFASLQPKRKDIALLSNNASRTKQYKTIHKSIDCKSKYNPQNVQSKQIVEQKPVKINGQFFELSLKKIIPPKRQSNFDKMVTRASSMGVLKHDLQNRKIQIINENGKMIEDGVFKSVKILHQNQFDAQKQAKYQRQIRDKHNDPSIRHDRIENRIKQELQHGQHLEGRYHDDVKKIWRDHLVLKKLQII